MHLRAIRTRCGRWLLTGAVALWLWHSAAQAFAARLELPPELQQVLQVEISTAMAAAPGFGGRLHRSITRMEHTMQRFGTVISTAAFTWLWVLVSSAIFLTIAALASATDFRMLSLRQGPNAVVRDLGHGVRMFFRILRDRRTPYRARAILAVALLYWLLPIDLVGDMQQAAGRLDDLLVAVLAAKLFIYLCPDALVAAHAEAVWGET